MSTRPRLPALSRRVPLILAELEQLYPTTQTALTYANPLQLVIATILSAQCTDQRVNLVTPALFARFPDAASLAEADRADIEALIHSTGFYRNKARYIQEFCQTILRDHDGRVPDDLETLIGLPGIGRKTANVVLGDAFGIPGITVDTHVGRLSRRLGFSEYTDPVKVERDLMQLIPQAEWTRFSHRLILHGRQVCSSRKPKCESCTLSSWCPKRGVEPKG